MKIRSQVGMVLNLDKCIGCHTCSITCKNVWTSREGMEYAWFNNVETKPGIGYPKEWENQEKWKGGWVRAADGSIRPRIGGKFRVLANIFANPDLPEIDDYYEPFDFDYQHLHTAPKAEHQPVARPRSLVSGQRMEKIEWGPNWEEILGTEFARRRKDKNFDQVQADIYGEYENTFMMYLPRLCEHCLNPACVASCPSGAIYKREEDGIVLIDQDKCRGWRMCISGCPYKKIYFNWKSGKSEKCIFCYPRIEAGQPTVCSETCVGRIRYLGVLLYDADRIHEVASCENERELYEKQLEIFLDPFDPAVIAQARYDGLFERGRSVSLLLFEHVHGESRDRGQAMVDLLDRYTRAGLQIDVPELPDYLPLYLEYLSLLPFAAASEGLAEVAHILGLLALRLEERGSAYAAIFEALLELGGERPDLGALRRDQAQEQRDDSLEAIDRAWEETPVSFTDPAGGCPSSSGRRPTASTEQPLQWVAQPVPQMQYRAAREGV